MTTQVIKEEEHWYVMRAYKSERKAEEILSGKNGLKYFIPKKKVIRSQNGKKIVVREPVIHSLVFVYATQREIVEFKRWYYNDLQFVTWTTPDGLLYLTVPDKQMDDFIAVCEQREREITFYKPEEIRVERGQKVKVHGGPFDNVEGIFVKVARKRSRQFVVIIPDVLAVSTEVSPDYLEVIE